MKHVVGDDDNDDYDDCTEATLSVNVDGLLLTDCAFCMYQIGRAHV